MGRSSPHVEVDGLRNAELRERVMYWAQRAAAALELPVVRVDVRGRLRAVRGHRAGVLPDGTIWIRRSVVSGSDDRLGFLIYEEAAHQKLLTYGVDEGLHTFLGAVLHELYAGWFRYHQLITVDGKDARKFVLGRLPVGTPSPEFAYELGGVIGPALAGSEKARRELQRWHESGKGDPALEGLSRRLQALQPFATDPTTLATRVAALYANGESGARAN